MASFFTLGNGGGSNQDHDEHRHNPSTTSGTESWFLNSNPAGGGTLELWQHRPNNQELIFQQQRLDLGPSAAGLGVGRPSNRHLVEASGGGGSELMMMRYGNGPSCQDCGNQAKKDCVHLRCRTCCKSRGLECSTHVKSTWVPAGKRRERQQQQQQTQPQGESVSKRLREHLPARSTSLNSTSIPSNNTSGLEVGNFPAEVSLPAVFSCVRVSAVDDGEDDEYAYKTAVSIGGHVFKGILYDQGSSSSGGSQPLNLITAISSSSPNDNGVVGSTSDHQYIDPAASLNFPATPINSFMSGSHFFSNPRS